MKKLICCFVLLSSLFCRVGVASPNPRYQVSDTNRAWALRVGPYKVISMMFEEDERGLKYHDLRAKEEVIAAPRTIRDIYPNRPNLQRQAVDALGQCMSNQIVNGKRKYSDNDVQIMVTYSKKVLRLN